MKYFCISIFILLEFSCSLREPRLISQKIQYGNIELMWFHYSYITNSSQDFVTIKTGEIEKEIYKSDQITSVYIENYKTIVIKIHTPRKGKTNNNTYLKKVFNFNIFIDSSATYHEFNNRPRKINN